MTFDDILGLDGYRGMTPLPDDFDAFWAERMAEADAVPLRFEVMPSEILAFGACEYLDLWFYGMGGARLYAKYLRPVSDAPRPVVLQFHGYPGATRSWFEQSSFAGMGCAVIALDNPGQGGKSEDVGGFVGTTVAGHLVAGLDGDPKDLYYVRLYQDVRILCRVVRALGEAGELDLGRVFVNGASQGGGMGIACCALNADLVDRAAILYPFLSDFRKVYELGADEIAYEGIRYYARWFDPDGEHEDEWFGKLAYVETNHFAHLVRCPVLFGTGLEDTVCPPETQCAVYNELSCPKHRLLFPGFGHEEIQDFDDQILSFFGKRLPKEGETDESPATVRTATLECALDGKTEVFSAPYDAAPGPLAFGNAAARYEQLALRGREGVLHEARLVMPAGAEQPPLVLMFHDLGRPPRGWFHLTRFVGAGWAVLQLANRPSAQAADLSTCVAEVLPAVTRAIDELPVDLDRVVAFGEGFGGALALEVAYDPLFNKAVALNPYPLESPAYLGGLIGCPVLLGTARMDVLADVAAQDELASHISTIVRKNYPKYAHERINAFENEFLAFLHD